MTSAIDLVPTKPGSRFGSHLVAEGKLTPERLRQALETQRQYGGRLGTNLLEIGAIHEDTLLKALGSFRHVRTVSAHQLRNIPREVLRMVPRKIAERHGVVPVERQGNTLILAAADPGDPFVEDELGALNSCLARTLVGLEIRIAHALQTYYRAPRPIRLVGLARRLDHGLTRPKAEPVETPADAEPKRVPAVPDVVAGKPKPSKEPPPLARAQATPPTIEIPAIPLPVDLPEPEPAVPAVPEVLAGPEYIELDEATQALLATDAKRPKTPEERLVVAADKLQEADIRDEIADALLEFCEPYFARRLIVVRRKEELVGWRGAGRGLDLARLREFRIGADEQSLFHNLSEPESFWLGPLPPLPANQRLAKALDAPPVKDCVALVLLVRSRVVGYLYGDNGDQGVGRVPLAELKRLVAKAGLAFEVIILKNKIRLF